MRGNCNHQPESPIKYGVTGAGQVLFNVEKNNRDVDGEVVENWDFDYVEVSDFTANTIVSAVVRSKYSQNEIDAIVANADSDPLSYMRYQNYRRVAERVASGTYAKESLNDVTGVIIEIVMPFSETLSGGTYEGLADYALKAGNKTVADVANDEARVYVRYLLDTHRNILEAADDVLITELDGLA